MADFSRLSEQVRPSTKKEQQQEVAVRSKKDLEQLRKEIREQRVREQIESAKKELPMRGVSLIQDFEKCHLKAYPDPLTRGLPYTIGWGSTRRLNGAPFQLGEIITQEEADHLFFTQLQQKYLPALQKIPYFHEMTQDMKGALLSFAYNLGKGFYGSVGFETITRNLKNKQWSAIPKTLTMYRNPGSNVEAGLLARRKEEGKLWMKGLENLRRG